MNGDANDGLLQLHVAFLRVRSAKQLLQLLNDRLKRLLGYTYTTIFLLDANRTTLYNYFADMQQGPFVRFAATTNPYLLHPTEAGKWKPLQLDLLNGERSMGQWILLYDAQEKITEENLERLNGFAALVAASLINILEYQEVLDREMENDIIQSLNIDFATIREKKDLLKVIHFKLKNLFDFSDQFVAVINEDKLTLSSFLQDTRSWADEHPKYQQSVAAKYPLNDGVFNKVILSKEPQTFDLQQQYARGNMPEYFQILYESGVRKVFMIGLHVRERMIGLWCICQTADQFMSADQLQLIKKVSSQLSIAVENIKANEAIGAREEEGRLLLRLSGDIANIRDKNDLFNAINRHLKKLFPFEEIVIMVLDEAQCCQPFLRSGNMPYQAATLKKDVYEDVFLQKLMQTEGILVLNMQQLYEDVMAPDYIRVEYENGIREKLAIKLKVEQRNIGVFFVNTKNAASYTDHELELIEGVSYQLSIAVSNILANEKVISQLDLIKRYKQQLEAETIYLKEEIETTHHYAEIIGNGAEMQKVFHLVSKVATADSTVLILGETGTGKELIARAIHNNSPRKDRLMVKVNCATLPIHLIESELFGHERGSFTGATERRIGKFELANHGTLFLDEIGELPPELQVKLLRALQEKEVERVGGKTTIKVDVRIIAATNRDLDKETAEGRFRNDLYYRLNIFPICLPPLRSRAEDIPLLAAHFIQRFSKKLGRQINGISSTQLEALRQYHWPGNVRELEHLIERSILLTTGNTITDIPLPLPGQQGPPPSAQTYFSLKTIDENEREHILNTLKYCRGKITGEGGAAQQLGIPNSTLSSKMKRLGIKREHFR